MASRISRSMVAAILGAHFAAAAPARGSDVPSPPGATCSAWSQPSGPGVALGIDVSGAATANEYELSFVVPVGWLFAVRARPVFYVALHGAGTAIGGKVEGLFRSKLLWNFVRVYAGGGPSVFYGLTGPNAKSVDGNWFAGEIDGNWFVGTEIFFDPRWSIHWEVGTSGGAFDTGAGAYTDVGLLTYLF